MLENLTTIMNDSGSKKILIGVLFVLFAVIVFGLVWFFLGSSASPVGFGWYLFSFAAGLSMIVLPCTLPLAFVIVPLSMGRGVAKGFMIALAFGLGVAFTLSMYGVLAAVIGNIAIGSFGAPLEVVKNWLYFIAGIFAYLFALGQLGLINFKMPTYSGAFPGFIQKQQDVFKALLLGLFLGNIGVGCPHPATPMILGRIAVSGDVFYGWLLFFVHATGRILPLLFLAILGIIGVNALAGLMKHKEKIERATGWGMVFVAAFILVLGLFSHDWWVLSGQHTFLESVTQEERFLGVVSDRLNVAAPHEHGLPPADHTGLLGLPLPLGTWTLLFLWILPLFWYLKKKKKTVSAMTDSPQKEAEKKTLPYLWWNFFTLSALLVLIFGYILPHRFLEKAAADERDHAESAAMQMEDGHAMTMEHMQEHMGEMMDDGHMMTDEHMMEHMEEESGGIMHEDDGHEHGGSSNYQEAVEVKEGLVVALLKSGPFRVSAPTLLQFSVRDAKTDELITNLEIEHEKYMHVIGVRDDLNEFLHIHPNPVLLERDGPRGWSVWYTFTKPGVYKIWTDIKVDGEVHTFGQPLLTIEGEGAVSEKNVSFETIAAAGDYLVQFKNDGNISAGTETKLHFTIGDKDRNIVEVEPYLGADMHLVAIKDDLSVYVHTHPAESEEEGENHDHSFLSIPVAMAHGTDGIEFSATFPSEGIYKLFAQFQPKGANLDPEESLTASFYVEVKKAAQSASASAEWWYKFVISFALILILASIVKKFITVPLEYKKGKTK